MAEDKDILIAPLSEASRQSAPFQSLTRDYALDVMNDLEIHRLFTGCLRDDLPMQEQIKF